MTPKAPLGVRRRHRLRIYSAALAEVDRRVENHLIASLHPIADLEGGAAVADHGELADVDDPVLDGGDAQALAVEDDGFGGNDQRLGLAGNLQLDLAIGAG